MPLFVGDYRAYLECSFVPVILNNKIKYKTCIYIIQLDAISF